MERSIIDEITARFQALASLVPLNAIRTPGEYDSAVSMLNRLLDAGAAVEHSALADLANNLGALIADYDAMHHSAELISPAVTLRFLMQQHHLTQSELPEVGSQGVISEILRGKRALTLRQIKALSARFHVPVRVFV